MSLIWGSTPSFTDLEYSSEFSGGDSNGKFVEEKKTS
jgi:hypothetical protein